METVRLDAYVLDTLMRDLVAHERRPSAFLVYLHLWRRAAGRRGRLHLSYQEMADATGLSRATVRCAVRTLVRRDLVRSRKAFATAVPCYTLVCHWRRP